MRVRIHVTTRDTTDPHPSSFPQSSQTPPIYEIKAAATNLTFALASPTNMQNINLASFLSIASTAPRGQPARLLESERHRYRARRQHRLFRARTDPYAAVSDTLWKWMARWNTYTRQREKLKGVLTGDGGLRSAIIACSRRIRPATVAYEAVLRSAVDTDPP